MEKKLRRITEGTLRRETQVFLTTIYINNPKYIPKKVWFKIVDFVMSRYNYGKENKAAR